MNRIDEIKERLSKATPGPWTYIPDSDSDDWQLHNSEYEYIKQDDSGVPISRENGEFIANAPTDIAYLLRVAEAAEVMREALEYYADESKWCGGFTIPSGKSISAVAIPTANANITYSYVTGDNGKIGREALAKVKELMGE